MAKRPKKVSATPQARPTVDDRAAHRADTRRQAAAAASRKDSAELREIGELPAVADPDRRAAAVADLSTFLRTYFPRRFSKPFGRPHETLIDALQRICEDGGLRAVALPRGYGKTTIVDGAVIWAVFSGLRHYVAYLAATGPLSRRRITSLKKELMRPGPLADDFPEICFPLRKMQGIAQRAAGQTYRGTPTAVVWGASLLVLPTIEGSQCSGAVIECGGLLSAVRGLQYVTEAGEVLRPDVAVLDDPQTRRSAKSKDQTNTRESLITGDLLYLAGHDTQIACVCSCTVIYPDDLADRLTSRTRNPEWQGQRERMVDRLPKAMHHWDRYGDLRREELRDKGTHTAADAYYLANRRAMDAGAKVTWDGMGSKDEHSPLQHAMNLYYRDRGAWAREAQNDPEAPTTADGVKLTALCILGKRSEFKPLTCPPDTVKITAFADLHKPIFYYVVAAYGTFLRGHMLWWDTLPGQRRAYFTLATAQETIQRAFPALGTIQAQIAAALQQLGQTLVALPIQRPDGKRQPVDLLMIDANWGETTDQVYQFAATAPLPTLPSHGRYYGARQRPMGWSKFEPGTDAGPNWQIPPIRPHRQTRACIWDTNRWKADFARALAAAPGTPGAWYLPDVPDDRVQLLTEHLLSESAVHVTGPYGEVDEFVLKPNEDNHLLDCCVGTLVGASVLRLSRDGAAAIAATPRRPKRAVKF